MSFLSFIYLPFHESITGYTFLEKPLVAKYGSPGEKKLFALECFICCQAFFFQIW